MKTKELFEAAKQAQAQARSMLIKAIADDIEETTLGFTEMDYEEHEEELNDYIADNIDSLGQGDTHAEAVLEGFVDVLREGLHMELKKRAGVYRNTPYTLPQKELRRRRIGLKRQQK